MMNPKLFIFGFCFGILTQAFGVNGKEIGKDQVEQLSTENCGYSEDKEKGEVENEYPWQVILTRKGDYLCGGTIVSKNKILTPAHCIERSQIEDLGILAGSSNMATNSPQRFEIQKLVKHSEYSSKNGRDKDIGIIQIKGEFKWNSNIRPICLPKINSEFLNDCKATEWIAKLGSELMDVRGYFIRPSDVSMKSTDECDVAFERYSLKFGNGTFCALKKTNLDISQTSGSPLICKKDGRFILYGITAFGLPNERFPLGYTNVASHMLWVNQQLGN